MRDHVRLSNRHHRKSRSWQPLMRVQGLESRLMLSAGVAAGANHHPAQVAQLQPRATNALAHQSTARAAAQHARRTSPKAEINAQYAKFVRDFAVAEQAYIESVVNGSSSTITVSANLTAPYNSPSTTMQVDNAAVFGPNGVFSTPVNASASMGGVPIGATFVITGRSGNTLIINPATSSNSDLAQGASLSASVQSTSQSSTAAIFPSFILNRTQLMAISLVRYFNSLPLKLPYFNAPPRTPNQRGAIQNYVYTQTAGNGLSTPSLVNLLLAVPLPATPGSDFTLYNSAIASAIEQSRLQILSGISQIYAGHIKIASPTSTNRLGTASSTNTGTTGTSTTGTSA